MPSSHQPNAAGPAAWIVAELVTSSTIATKIATISDDPSTRGSIPPATRSDRNTSARPDLTVVVIGCSPRQRARWTTPRPHHNRPPMHQQFRLGMVPAS